MNIHPIHPTFELAQYQQMPPDQYLVVGSSREPSQMIQNEDDAIDQLMTSHREGIEGLAGEINRLLDERTKAGALINQALNRDHLYLENLILDRYRIFQRPTDDPVYVQLRLQQLGIEAERRREESALWRDTVLLAKERSELLRRVEDAKRREDLLSGDQP